MKTEKSFICKICKAIVPREKRIEHLIKVHNPMELYDYAEVITDNWEK